MPPSGHARLEAPHSNRRDLENLRKLSSYLWEYRGRVLLALACLIIAKLAVVAVPLVLKEIINALDASTTDSQALLLVPTGLVAAYGALRMLSSLFNELRDALFSRVRFRAMHQLSVRVLEHLHKLSLAYHLERHTGSVSRDLSRGTSSLSSIVNYLVFNIIPTIAEFLLVATILLTNYSSSYLVVVAVTVVIYVFFTVRFSGWRMRFRHEMNRLDSAANGSAIDSLLNYETVKYFNNENLELDTYDKHLGEWADAGVKSQVTMSALNFGQSVLVTIGVTAIMFLAAGDVANGSITIGDIVLINALMLQLFIPLNFLGVVYRSLQYALADMDLVIKLLERQPEILDRKDAAMLQVTEGRIEFRDVSFSYLPERPILHGINFSVEPGSKVAVVGPSGSGKSTISRLLFRFYDIDSGQILIDGQDVREVSQASLRKSLGVVPQDTVMFNNSIAYNLDYAKPGVSEEKINAAIDATNLRTLVDDLPEGLKTVVGERGLKLSGGEKQRVAIARVMIKDPPILVFDEATSSLDTQTEQSIVESLKRAAHQATTLVIAHRLSTIVDADSILVLDKGQIVEQGTHEELLAAGQQYATLWLLQQAEQDDNKSAQ